MTEKTYKSTIKFKDYDNIQFNKIVKLNKTNQTNVVKVNAENDRCLRAAFWPPDIHQQNSTTAPKFNKTSNLGSMHISKYIYF